MQPTGTECARSSDILAKIQCALVDYSFGLDMKTYIFTYCLALLFSIGLMPIVIVWAKKRRLVDEPDPRKIHSQPIARVGGVVIYVAAMLTLLPVLALPNNVGKVLRLSQFELLALFCGSTLIFFVGLYDDLKGVRVRSKLLAQFIAALCVCGSGIYIDRFFVGDLWTVKLGLFSWPLTILWIIGITNAINLIDGLDGLAAGICAIACGVMAILSMSQGNIVLATITLALFGSITGFLLFNFHPARIFMGDCGSLFLGFTIATVSVLTTAKSEALVGICLPMLVLGIPIFDTLLSILRRFLNRRGILSPDRGHFHHLLLDRGLKQHHIAILAYVITAGISGLGLLMLVINRTASLMIFVISLVLLLLVFKLTGSLELKRTLRDIQTRSRWAQRRRTERKKFEEAQLYFRNVETFAQWWNCMCKAAKTLEFARLSLEYANHETIGESWCWQNSQNSVGTLPENRLQITVPLVNHHREETYHIHIDIVTKESLESASQRAVLFARLADENSIDDLKIGWQDAAKEDAGDMEINTHKPSLSEALLSASVKSLSE